MWKHALLLNAITFGIATSSISQDTSYVLDISPSTWKVFNCTIDGRLRSSHPFPLPCFASYHNSSGTFNNFQDAEACQNVEDKLKSSQSLVSKFGSYHNPSFATCMATGQRCTLSPDHNTGLTNETCFQGSIPEYYVDVKGVRDLQKTLLFARKHKIPITVKNTGHDFRGRSSAPNTLGIWYVFFPL